MARGATRSSADSTHSRRSNGWRSMSIRPASIFEKSRMSLMMVSSASPESRIVAAKSRCSSVSGVSSSRPLMPMTAFIGVRISWLIVARKALLASLAASAAARASCASLNRRAFWIAITPWSAKVWSRLMSLSEYAEGSFLAAAMQPMRAPCQIIGATTREPMPVFSANRRMTSGHAVAGPAVRVVQRPAGVERQSDHRPVDRARVSARELLGGGPALRPGRRRRGPAAVRRPPGSPWRRSESAARSCRGSSRTPALRRRPSC